LEREFEVAIEWVPFELHPEIPHEGIPRDRVFPSQYRDQVESGVNRLAREVGKQLKLHDRLINSRPALQAAEFARGQDRFNQMHQGLFSAYWDEGRDVSDLAVLKEVAERAGVDPAAMEKSIAANEYGDYLDARRAEAEELMISGIPAHVVADRYLVMGAQPYDVFQRLMGRLGIGRRQPSAKEDRSDLVG
jgi:predicted DsbA family dithiol-disulfide isomerase